MPIKIKLKILGVICAFFLLNKSFSQSSSSTYSALGLGDFNNSGLTHNQAMGGLGISYGNSFGVNMVNPAVSVRNQAFNFQAAFNYRRMQATTESTSGDIDGGGLSYVSISLPVIPRKWTIGLGLNEISSVNYRYVSNNNLEDSDVSAINQIQGDGGISEAYLQTGFELFRNFNIGFHGSYIFGSTIRKHQLILSDENLNPIGVSSEYYERLTLSDLAFKTGVYYAFRLGDQKYLNLGAIYHLFGNLNGKEFAKVADIGQASDPNSIGDLISDDIKGHVFVPNKVGYGVTYEKINKFAIGLEAQQQDFRKYRNFNGTSGNLGNSYRVGLGGQIVPDAFSMESALLRATYRMGLEYERLPYIVNNTNINDIGINFGTSIPMSNLSLLNVALKIGTRGTTDNGLIRENYFRVSLGFSINDNSWFYKKVFE